MVIRTFFCNLRVSCKTVCQQKAGVVRRGVTIDRDHIIGVNDTAAQRLLQKRLADGRIRCDVGEHGAHIRMNHAGAFAHTADRNRLSVQLDCHGNFLIDGICRHDCLRSRCPSLYRTVLCRCKLSDALVDAVHRKLHANHACRADKHRIFRYLQETRRCLRLLAAVVHPLLSRTCICNAGIDNDRLRIRAILHNLLIPHNRRRFHYICRECSSQLTRRSAVNQRHVHPVFVFDICRSACCLKPLRGSHTALYLFHFGSSLYYNH